jgi:hypothetical protein
VLVFSFSAAAQDMAVSLVPSTSASPAAAPPAFSTNAEFPFRVGIGYQFTDFRGIDGLTYRQNGINTDLVGYLGHDFALEGDVAAGFGWTPYSPTVKLESSEVFYGGGIRIGSQRNRFQPWANILVGGEHFRFSQTSPALGIDNGFAWQVGVGADIKMGPRFFWRIQGAYLGTHIFSATQANYQFGTGVGIAF